MSFRFHSFPLTLGLLFLLASSAANAQSPTITSLSPLGLKPGAATDVTVRGGNLAEMKEFWTSSGFNAVLSPDVKDNGKNAAQAVYRVTVPQDTPVGLVGVRVATPTGVSPMKLMLVDDLPSVAKAGNNTAIETAQSLTLPVAVDGVMGALQRHYYKFSVTAGQQVSFEVVARRLGSTLDPMVRILDSGGRELVYSDDVPGLRSDARICRTFETAGEYYLEVRDIRFQGSANHFYRLRVGDFPCVRVPYPLGVKRGASATIAFAGEHAEDADPVKLNLPADYPHEWLNVGAKRAGGASSGFVSVAVGNVDEFLETEPNNDPKKGNPAPREAAFNGRIDEPGDIDHFTFTAKKGEKLSFVGTTRRQGAPTALHMRLLNAAGAQVGVIEDFGVGDPTINYNIPADGDYTIAVGDLHHRGGPQFAYRIELRPNEPGFDLEAASDVVNVPAGGSQKIVVNSKRRSYNGPIELSANNLPAGVTAVPTVIGPGLNTVVFTLTGTDKSPTGKIVPLEIVGKGKAGTQEYVATASIGDALKAAYGAIAWAPIGLTETLAIGVSPKAQVRLRTEVSEVVFGKSLSGKVKVIADRDEGFNEAITLAVEPAKGGLPTGVTAAVKPIPKDKNEIEITFTGAANAPIGEFTAVLLGTIKQGKVTVVQPTPGIRLKLDQPLKVTVAPVNKLTKGTEVKVKVTVERNPAAPGDVVLTLQNLPKGVTAKPATIPKDKNELEIALTVAKDAAPAKINNFSVKGEVTVGKTKLSAVSANVPLTVE